MKLSFLLCLLLLGGCAPSSELLQNKSLAETDGELAVLDIQNQDMQNARTHLAEAQALVLNDPCVLVAEGYYDEKAEDPDAARRAYAAAIKIAPHDAEIENDYGVFLYQQEQYAQALAYFRAAGQNPENSIAAEALDNAGLAELKLNQPQQAQFDFNQATAEGLNNKISS